VSYKLIFLWQIRELEVTTILMKTITHIIIFLVLVSCTTDEEKSNITETKSKVSFNECLSNTYPELTNEINKFLPTLYPKCENFEISYKELSKGQIDTTELFKNESIKHYLNNFEEADESILNQKFNFKNLEHCSDGKIYQEINKCNFYVGGVYISDDRTLQLIRLYQEGEFEIFDIFIKIKDGEVDVLAVG